MSIIFTSIIFKSAIFLPSFRFRDKVLYMQENTNEEFKVSGEHLMDKVKELIKEGNARRIIIKNDKGETLIELPLTLGAVGAIIAPMLAAVGAVAALVSNCTIVVEKRDK